MTNVISLNSDFSKGYRCAKKEVALGDISCVKSALMGFALDPADSDFQRGYHQGLLNKMKGVGDEPH